MSEKHYVLKIVENAIKINVLEMIISLILFRDIGYFYGVLTGNAISVFTFLLLYISIKILMGKDSVKAQRIMIASYFVRYLLVGILLVAVSKIEAVNFYAAVIALFNIKIAIYIYNFYSVKK